MREGGCGVGPGGGPPVLLDGLGELGCRGLGRLRECVRGVCVGVGWGA